MKRPAKSLYRPAQRDEFDLTYVEWISIANYHPDQNGAWRDHELKAREKRSTDSPEWIDLGGEA